VAVARSSSGSVAIRYVLPVLWMTSRLAIAGRMAIHCNTGAESDVYECLVLMCRLTLVNWLDVKAIISIIANVVVFFSYLLLAYLRLL